MSILINLFESTASEQNDEQYQQFLEMQRLETRKQQIQKEKIGCCGVVLTNDKPELAIVDKELFAKLAVEEIEAEKSVVAIHQKLERFDPVAKEAAELGVEMPTVHGIQRALVATGNLLVSRSSITKSRLESLMSMRPELTAVEALAYSSIAELEIVNAELQAKYDSLKALHARSLKFL